MQNSNTIILRRLFIKLLSNNQIDLKDEAFWEQICSFANINIQDYFILYTPAGEIRKLKELNPYNIAALCYKNIERIYVATNSCQSLIEHRAVLNCIKLLICVMPKLLEDEDWIEFFWSNESLEKLSSEIPLPIGKTLLFCLCDLMFCPDFTVSPQLSYPETPNIDLANIDSCDYIWENGIGASHRGKTYKFDEARFEVLRLILVCLSQDLYMKEHRLTMDNTFAQETINCNIVRNVQHLQASDNSSPQTNNNAKNISTLNINDNKNASNVTNLPSIHNSLSSISPLSPYSDQTSPGINSTINDEFENIDLESSNEITNSTPIKNLDSTPIFKFGNAFFGSNLTEPDNMVKDDSGITGDTSTHQPPPSPFLPHQQLSFDSTSDGSNHSTTHSNSLLSKNLWIEHFSSSENRHALAIFTSLINLVFSHGLESYQNQTVGNWWQRGLFRFSKSQERDTRDALVELCLHILLVVLANEAVDLKSDTHSTKKLRHINVEHSKHLFALYINRLHDTEDFEFIIKGMIGLLNESVPYYNSRLNSYNQPEEASPSFSSAQNVDGSSPANGLNTLLGSLYISINPFNVRGPVRIAHMYQEVMVLFWLLCDLNKKFIHHLMKTNKVLDIVVALLYQLMEAKSDTSKMGVMHVGIFILLCLSGERNFGVRLNKPFTLVEIFKKSLPMLRNAHPMAKDISHADLLIMVIHDIIVKGQSTFSNLYESLLIVIVNISPYLKGLSMISAKRLLHLIEGFATPHFLYSKPYNYRLVFFLLEMFNNLIQYQFDSNSPLVYQIIKKRKVFYGLLNLPTDQTSIDTIYDASRKNQKNIPDIKVQDKDTTSPTDQWKPLHFWAAKLKHKLPLQTILRLLQVLIPQIELTCLSSKSFDEPEILRFLQQGTLVGLLPVPHPILIRRYQPNKSTLQWFLTYIWGIIYLKNMDPPIWFETDVKLFEIKKI